MEAFPVFLLKKIIASLLSFSLLQNEKTKNDKVQPDYLEISLITLLKVLS